MNRSVVCRFGLLGLLGGGSWLVEPTSATAQNTTVNQLQELQSPESEAELPDMEAIEKGARPQASVSFGRKPAAGDESKPGQQGGKSVNITPQSPDRGAQNIESAALGLSPPGGIYGVEATSVDVSDEQNAQAHAESVPELHVVKKGDTLWSMCEFYFRDPWSWPRLWAQNPLITNPHWIFPGDVVRLRANDGSAAPPPGPAPAGTPGISSNRQGSLGSKAVVLRSLGYVEAQDLVAAAVVTGSREEKIMLATNDQAYLAFSKERPLKAGERYTVFMADVEHPVRSPDTGEILGYLVRIFGDIVIDQIAEKNTGRGTLLDLIDPVERGYLVSPLVRQFKRVEPRPSAVNLEARVVAAFTPARMLAGENFVVLSRGAKDGIQVGNRTYVVRRGDGYRGVMEKWDTFDTNYPREVVGEIWVVDVKDNTSVAWIARTSKEIRVGEVTEMRKGY